MKFRSGIFGWSAVLVAASLLAVVAVRGGATQSPGRIAKFVDSQGGLGDSEIREDDAGRVGIGVGPKSDVRLLVDGAIAARGDSSNALGALVVSQNGAGPIATFRQNQTDVKLRVDADGIDVDGAIRVAGVDIVDATGAYVGDGVQRINPMQVALNRWYEFNEGGYHRNLAGGTLEGLVFDGHAIWVSKSITHEVTKLRASDGAVLGSFWTTDAPGDLAYDGAYVWVGHSVGKLTKIQALDGIIVDEIAVPGSSPLLYDGSSIWYSNVLDEFVGRVRASEGTLLDTVEIGGRPVALAFDGTHVWVARLDGTVRKIRASDGTILGDHPIGSRIEDIRFDGTNLWVAVSDPASLTKVRPADGAILATYPLATAPRSLGFDGTTLWVSNLTERSLVRIRPRDGQVLGRFDLPGPTVSQFAFDGANMWAAYSTSLMKL